MYIHIICILILVIGSFGLSGSHVTEFGTIWLGGGGLFGS